MLVVTMDEETLPLFVLPMVLFPGETQELRVFEPRYRQMLDTCILDERPFGLVLNDPFEPTNGWDGPRRHGCEAVIVRHETRGMNHFITIEGGRRFFVEEVVEPALPPLHDPTLADLIEDGIAPDVHTLLERVPEDGPHQKLYISAKVRYLPEEGTLSDADQTTLEGYASTLIRRAGLNMDVDSDMLDHLVERLCDEQISESRNSVYNIAALCLNNLEGRQQLLACSTAEEAMNELQMQLTDLGGEAE
jgi:Lon protease-like protein